MKVIIVGGVAGGATAAARLRRLDEEAEIMIIDRGSHVSFANCGLPYYLGDVIKDQEDLILQTPQGFKEKYNVEVRLRNEVTGLDAKNKTIAVRNLDTGEAYEESYDNLVLSPGASPIVPPIEGARLPGVFTLRTVPDTLAIDHYMTDKKPSHAVVVGGGFIGLEMAENLLEAGMEVTVVELMDHVIAPLDEDMARVVEDYLTQKGIGLKLKNGLQKIEQEGEDLKIHLQDGVLTAQMVLLSVGVRPDTAFLKESGLDMDPRGAIIVNKKLQTNLPHVYALGDAAKIPHGITDTPTVVALAGPANKQARIVADRIAGMNNSYGGAIGTSIIKIFDMAVATTGLNERAAQQEGYVYDKLIIAPAPHATYYPGGKEMFIKVLWNQQDHKILGAQIVGYGGVDKRIDVIATAIGLNAHITDLTALDLAYAPPFGSAKDPINMVGFVAENLIGGKMKLAFWEDLKTIQEDENALLLDVREKEELADGMIPGAVHIPLGQLRKRINELPKDKKIYAYCYSGVRSYTAARILIGLGYDGYNMAGGWSLYEKQHR